jgi:hypothetical protein
VAERTSACDHAKESATVSMVTGLKNVPHSLSVHTTLARVDYIDLFTLATPLADEASAEEWARAILERSDLARRGARPLWRVMGLRLGPRHSADHVQGWRISARGSNWIRVDAESWYMQAQAVCQVDEEHVSVSLSLSYDHPLAALVWAAISGPHQRAVPVMLIQAVGLIGQTRHDPQVASCGL